MGELRRCHDEECATILEIVNAAALRYRGVIPPDCWHEPYMSRSELDTEIRGGVEFWGYELEGVLLGVMGIQRLPKLDLIRHAYVRPRSQRSGVGAALIDHLQRQSGRCMLVGTWAAASWAIRFYERHHFRLLHPETTRLLLSKYWRITPRQQETSVVLAHAGSVPHDGRGVRASYGHQ